MYSIKEHDHHPGEPAVVVHSGKALTRTSASERVVHPKRSTKRAAPSVAAHPHP
jgi:hypothetical protein